jgi:KDO2-lipid IV(A) lauroyltransferase
MLSADRVRQTGRALAASIPWPVWWPVTAAAVEVLLWRPSRGVRQWQVNVEALTGQRPGRGLTRRALWSWARNLVESLHLGSFPRPGIDARVVLDPDHEHRLRGLAASPGVVAALPHMGSWDLAGAWACGVGMPVSTVAEELLAPEFARFRAVRERLGFVVHGHRQPGVMADLETESRQGRLVCLLADRDFSRRGVPVCWPSPSGGIAATMPSGPAQLALRTGAVLLGVACHYEGRRIRLVVSEPIQPAGATHAEKVAGMTQALCDFFAAEIVRHPHDWHMMQPIFPGLRVDARRP